MSPSLSVMSGPRSTNKKMSSFLLLIAATMLVVEASSSAKFLSVPAFHNKIENKLNGSRRAFSVILSLQQQQQTKIISVRGGAKNEEENGGENDDKDDDAVETGKIDGEEEVSEDDEEYDETSDDEDETDDDSSDVDDYYDDETDEEEEESGLASQLKKKSSITSNKEKSSEFFVEPYFISPSLQMYTTFGTILLSRKIDMFNPKMIRLVRFLFVVYVVVQQVFIFRVRMMAKRNNDRTPVHVQNPLTSMISSQLEKQPAGGNEMVKNLASSFLKTESTIAEYDMGQAKKMQGGILFNMALMWFLHFKMQQVQPLLVTTINGFMQLAYNPLFQVYIMGRNLERPFKSPEVFKDPRVEEESATTDTTTQDETTDSVIGDSEGEVGKEVEEESEDESSDSSDDEDEDSSDDVDVEKVEDTSDEEDDSE